MFRKRCGIAPTLADPFAADKRDLVTPGEWISSMKSSARIDAATMAGNDALPSQDEAPTTRTLLLPGLTRQSSSSRCDAYPVKLDHRVTTLRVGPVMTRRRTATSQYLPRHDAPTTPAPSLPGLTRQSSSSRCDAYPVKLDHQITTLRVGPVMTLRERKYSGTRKVVADPGLIRVVIPDAAQRRSGIAMIRQEERSRFRVRRCATPRNGNASDAFTARLRSPRASR
ncbi:hypothetical protein JQ557_32605 [Bradyrhizobium sp. U87765 SZCCT0131]|uniref:hypothetical protein n=1 Tax=unclassified Bradyrhizobium TaxID=2631580 RepID=UPI001BA49E49|nr:MULTISPECIES: hypothetical protein [unclassified Bradyrhizobium]MBR1222782.1 hypothetical protein [Bradyrhizobium sp. U87765 SZCCT0131]MBR1265137.1 hypothetical protein [Bradyrhizobium sp. U87765 SZCCT0134]MBR1303084.1 hypothetical protein [Bradyrhizobium sp. U87765 SZCCT0110]MBR1318690.1 hypothetical protein [Bradyrhizobium sp. U87765 SZCCT0109]MBR1347013.1 hypothetical protein [Bradyrhizobium sp. U87765 SZCCT0048]